MAACNVNDFDMVWLYPVTITGTFAILAGMTGGFVLPGKRVWHVLGDASYALYLLHNPLFSYFRHLFGPDQALAIFLATLIVVILLVFAVDGPLRRYLNRVMPRKIPGPAIHA
jgi:peptidoglycan/LPS O-acetylase OafA/YrhL